MSTVGSRIPYLYSTFGLCVPTTELQATLSTSNLFVYMLYSPTLVSVSVLSRPSSHSPPEKLLRCKLCPPFGTSTDPRLRVRLLCRSRSQDPFLY